MAGLTFIAADKMKSFFLYIFEGIKIAALVLAIVLPIRYFLIQPFFVKGSSMEPNFDDGQYLVVDEISYRFRQPARGEVVVFRYPLNTKLYFIKRIIGLPGETVEIINNRVKIYNSEHFLGFVLDEDDYLPPAITTYGNQKITLAGGEYFVLGDNRQASDDSRNWGVLSDKYLIGRAWLRAWPPKTAEVLAAPRYGY